MQLPNDIELIQTTIHALVDAAAQLGIAVEVRQEQLERRMGAKVPTVDVYYMTQVQRDFINSLRD